VTRPPPPHDRTGSVRVIVTNTQSSLKIAFFFFKPKGHKKLNLKLFGHARKRSGTTDPDNLNNFFFEPTPKDFFYCRNILLNFIFISRHT